jgi:hypothetical protein
VVRDSDSDKSGGREVERDWPVGKRSPPGTKFGSPPVMGILFHYRGGKDPRHAARICDRSWPHPPMARDGTRAVGRDTLFHRETPANLAPHAGPSLGESSSRPSGLGEGKTGTGHPAVGGVSTRSASLRRVRLPMAGQTGTGRGGKIGTGHERDGTHCFIEKRRRIWPSPSGLGEGEDWDGTRAGPDRRGALIPD